METGTHFYVSPCLLCTSREVLLRVTLGVIKTLHMDDGSTKLCDASAHEFGSPFLLSAFNGGHCVWRHCPVYRSGPRGLR